MPPRIRLRARPCQGGTMQASATSVQASRTATGEGRDRPGRVDARYAFPDHRASARPSARAGTESPGSTSTRPAASSTSLARPPTAGRNRSGQPLTTSSPSRASSRPQPAGQDAVAAGTASRPTGTDTSSQSACEGRRCRKAGETLSRAQVPTTPTSTIPPSVNPMPVRRFRPDSGAAQGARREPRTQREPRHCPRLTRAGLPSTVRT